MKITTQACSIAGLTLTISGVTLAQDYQKNLEHETLDRTTITADTEPLSGNNVSSEEIKVKNPADLKTLFKKSPNININGGANQAQQIFVNGFESTNMNVTIDGASQGNLFHHQSSTLVDPSLLKRVDVLPGAGSALDGPGALAGSIRFETKNAFDYLPYTSGVDISGKSPVDVGYKRFASDSKGTYFNNGDGFNLSQTIAGKFSPEWGYLLSGSYTDRDAYKDGNGNTVDNSDYTSGAGLFKISGRLQNGHNLDLGYEYNQTETLSYDRVNIDTAFFRPPRTPGLLQPMKATRSTASLNYDYLPSDNDLIHLESNLFFTEQDFERKQTNVNSSLATLGLDLRNTFKFWKLVSTVGFDYQDKKGTADYGPAEAMYNPDQDEKEQIFGLYNQNILSVHETVDFSFGARYDNYDYTDGFGQDYKSDRVSPNGSIIWRPVDNLTLDGGYSEAYRGVGIREAFLPGSRPADLGGEKANTLKANIAYDNGSFFASGSIFQQEIKDYINPVASRGAGRAGDVETKGYEARLGFRKNGFVGSVAVTEATPEINGQKNVEVYGINVAGRRWLADLNYNHQDTGLGLGYFVEYREAVDAEYLGYPGTYTKESYALNSLYASWDVQQVKGLRLQLNIDNLFDKFYQDQSVYVESGLASPGREVRLSANYVF
ncbi:TonB-dependent receptor domain-containing protein [Rubritalea tangerina]|uniref:TonB-dependent receptor domain-containing protein n=1 Tax=Rubritalea tangerina TaxID=430798 RepID=A0ABW4Z9G0_9BACT